MSCDELLRRLAEYEDGVLDAGLCRVVEEHLRDCDACAGLRQDFETLSRLCRSCSPPRLPDAIRQRIARRLAGEG